MLSNVLLSGGSGMIGSALSAFFSSESIAVTRLVRRSPDPDKAEIRWNPEAATPEGRLPSIPVFSSLDAAIHLSGANIAGHLWTASYRDKLRRSRLVPTRAFCEILGRLRNPPPVMVCASAIGIYGDWGEEILDEDSPAGAGFLPDLCREWEAAAEPAEALGIRVVHLRFGVVLDPSGGALAKLLPVFRLGAGGKLGNGGQWMSWVTLSDVVRAI